MEKISYIIPSNKPKHCLENLISSIHSLDKHDMEIIVIGTEDPQITSTKFLSDDGVAGCVYSYNKGVKNSSGSIVSLLCDDVTVAPNFLNNISHLKSREKEDRIPFSNACHWVGGPGHGIYIRNEKRYGDYALSHITSNNIQNLRAYNTINFPFLYRRSIEEYFGGVVFNESFSHHYVDSWMGFFIEMINQNSYAGPTDDSFVSINQDYNLITPPNYERDEREKQIFLKLIEKSSSYYNEKITL